ncbi:MAG: hypothetical protein ACOYME_08750 [Prochlorotrichaceae cyanobacterium]|jgi:hypothetical protein
MLALYPKKQIYYRLRSFWGTVQKKLEVLGLLLTVIGVGSYPAQALPGQSVRDAQAWIQAHPTLKPLPGETLVVRKADTAAQRFSFVSSIFPVYAMRTPERSRVIRHESIELFDMVNGVSAIRLEESLRVIYGAEVYGDYDRAAEVYRYPASNALGQGTALAQARQGQLRLGDRYGYWLEVVQTPEGRPYNGQMVVFLKEDLANLQAQLKP